MGRFLGANNSGQTLGDELIVSRALLFHLVLYLLTLFFDPTSVKIVSLQPSLIGLVFGFTIIISSLLAVDTNYKGG